MFLLEKLPRESAQAAEEGPGAGVMLSRSISAQLMLCLKSPWTPPFCKENGTAWSGTNFWNEVCAYTYMQLVLNYCTRAI